MIQNMKNKDSGMRRLHIVMILSTVYMAAACFLPFIYGASMYWIISRDILIVIDIFYDWDKYAIYRILIALDGIIMVSSVLSLIFAVIRKPIVVLVCNIIGNFVFILRVFNYTFWSTRHVARRVFFRIFPTYIYFIAAGAVFVIAIYMVSAKKKESKNVSVQSMESSGMLMCEYCNAATDMDAKYCPRCGMPIRNYER